MKTIESYIPEYVLRLQEKEALCRCVGCQQHASRVTLDWANQRRHSARLECDTVAREVLLREDAFVLHAGQAESAGENPPMSEALQHINQGCIHLLVGTAAEISHKLYAIGILISKSRHFSAQDIAEQQVENCVNELNLLLDQQQLAEQFAQLPAIGKYKREALRALSCVDLDASLDPMTGMALVLKMNELKVLPDSYLEQSLSELEQDAAVSEFMQQHSATWLNFILYRCYHDVFPGENAAEREQAYRQLCQDFFNVKTLCGLLVQSGTGLNAETIPALVAGLRRSRVAIDANPEALLIGIALLK